MANLSSIQEQLRVIKSGTEQEKKHSLTPDSIADVRKFIAEERANRTKGTHYSLEGSFVEWEDLIKNFEADKSKITTKTAAATAAATPPTSIAAPSTHVGHSVVGAITAPVEVKNIIADIDKKIQKGELTNSLDKMTMDKLESSLKYTENIAKLIPTSHTALGRGVVGSMMLGRLQELGYHIGVNSDGTVFVESSHKDAIDVENKINAQIKSPGSVMSDITRSGMLSMSPTFRQYASSKTIDGKATPPQKLDDYKKYLDLKMSQDPKGAFTFSDASFISSYTKGGFNNYDFATMMSQSRDLQKVGAFVESYPAIVAQVQSLTASPAIVPSTIIAPAVVSSAPDTKAGKAAGVVGETVGTVAGATGAVIGTVATETVSTWSTILSEATKTGGAMGAIGVIGLLIGSIWKFGFWKTMMGVVGIGGASAIANAAENGTFDRLADKMRQGGNKLGQMADKVTGNTTPANPALAQNPTAAPAAAPSSTFDLSKLTPSQTKAYEKFKDDADIKKYLDNVGKSNPQENGDINAYATFIFSDAFQNQKLENLIYTTDSERDIFHNDVKSGFIRKPANLNSIILKRILRLSLTGNHMLAAPTAPAKEGDKERTDFGVKYPETTWKIKTLAELNTKIHK